MLRNAWIALVLLGLAATSAVASSVVPASARRLGHHKAVHTTARAAHRGAARSASHVQTRRKAGPVKHAHRRAAARAARAHAWRRQRISARPTLRRASFVRRRPVFASPLKGSLESLQRQNERAEADGLERILDEQDLANRIQEKLLVPIPVSSSLAVNTDLPENHRYCRSWTASFLSDLAREHAAQFHKPLIVSSAVRTVEYQQELMRFNHNAAAAEGDIVSPHLTGGTIDIAKSGMTWRELRWMRNRLLAMQLAGTIDVEEEFRQPCFHITVYRNYVMPPPIESSAPLRRHSLPAAQVAAGAN
jgi:hypothetical protein